MSLYKNCGWWKNFDCIFGFSMKSYVRNTINLSCAKILLTSVISWSTLIISWVQEFNELCFDSIVVQMILCRENSQHYLLSLIHFVQFQICKEYFIIPYTWLEDHAACFHLFRWSSAGVWAMTWQLRVVSLTSYVVQHPSLTSVLVC